MYKELTPKQRIKKIDGIISRIELERQNHLHRLGVKVKAKKVGVCVYDHKQELNNVRDCFTCKVQLCEFCGWDVNGKAYCNKCFEELK